MNKTCYNKLVRDNVKDKIEGKGELCEVYELSDAGTYQQALLKKVKEEAEELSSVDIQNQSDFLNEYCDLMVVLDALIAELDISEADIQVAMTENVTKKGLYKKRHFLVWSEEASCKKEQSDESGS